MNDEIDEAHKENDIGLTITSFEYGKVLVNEVHRSTFKKLAADSTYNDNISNGKVKDMEKGYLYFIIDGSMPFTSLKLNVPAQFKEGISISEDYEYNIELYIICPGCISSLDYSLG